MKKDSKDIAVLPYKLNVPVMIRRNRELISPFRKINSLMNLLVLQTSGVIAISDLIQITKECKIEPVFWEAYITRFKSDEQLIFYGKLLSFAGQCGILNVTDDLRKSVNDHLEYIYKNYK